LKRRDIALKSKAILRDWSIAPRHFSPASGESSKRESKKRILSSGRGHPFEGIVVCDDRVPGHERRVDGNRSQSAGVFLDAVRHLEGSIDAYGENLDAQAACFKAVQNRSCRVVVIGDDRRDVGVRSQKVLDNRPVSNGFPPPGCSPTSSWVLFERELYARGAGVDLAPPRRL
jgi:hypothetical protein